MKKIVLILFSFVLAGSFVLAQNTDVGHVSGLGTQWGFKVGCNMSNSLGASGGSVNNGNFKPCLLGGLFIEVPVSERWREEVYLQLTEKGSKSKYSFGGTTYSGKSSALYLTLGGTQKYYFSRSWYFAFGEYVEFGLVARSSSSVDKTVYNLYKGDKELRHRRFGFGALVGMGVNLGKHLTIEPDFTIGLTNLSRAKNTYLSYFGINVTAYFKF